MVFMAKLSESAVQTITEICHRYENEPTPLMMILSDIQNEYGYIPLEVQEIVSKETKMGILFLLMPSSMLIQIC